MKVHHWAWVFLWACSFDLATAPGVENRCAEDAECSDGSVCDADTNRCIAPTGTGLDLVFEVTPPPEASGRTPVPRTLGPERIDGPVNLQLTVPGIISVFGDVCESVTESGRSECKSAGSVTASLSFRALREDGLPVPAITVLTVGETALAPDGLSADYVARLLRDQEYEVSITPVGDDAERYYPVSTRIRTPGDGDVTRISLRFWEERTVFRGRVINAERQPVEGVVVRALDRESGDVISAAPATDAEGLFDLVLDPARAADFVLRLEGGEASTLFPTLVQDPTFFFPGTARPTILVPDLTPVTVRGAVETTGAEPVSGATLTFRNESVLDGETGLAGRFEATVSADAAGQFEAVLLPGTYDVVVAAPSRAEVDGMPSRSESSGIRLYRNEVFNDETNGRVWVLPDRVQLMGQVRSPSQEGMNGVRVSATALGTEIDGLPESPYNRSNETTTGATGNFFLPVDVGTYDVYLKAPADSGFPWVVLPNVTFDSDASTVSRTLSMVAPMPVSGRLVNSDDEPIAEAEVRALAYTETNGMLRTLPVGRAMTDEEGNFVLLLPPSL